MGRRDTVSRTREARNEVVDSMSVDYNESRPPADPDASGQRVLSLSSLVTEVVAAELVTVYVDYENIRLSLRSAFNLDTGHFNPKKLADRIVARRLRRSALREVRVYRTMADPNRDRRRARDDMRRIHRWLSEENTVFVGRPLRYIQNTGVVMEKGIDVALAIDAIVNAIDRDSDAVVVASRDSDFEPLLETLMVHQAFGRHVETVSVSGMSRLSLRRTELPWCHYLSREDFEAIRDDA